MLLVRTVASPLLVAVALTLGVGCEKKPQLTEVEVPEAGVTLRYDLTAGQEYGGHIKMRSSAQTPMGDMVSTVEFDVALVVAAKEEAGAKLVRATVKNIQVSARMPEGIPAAAAGIDPAAASALNGMELRFNLDPRGEISNTPEPPEGAAPEIAGMIGMITSALTAGLSVRLPEEPLKAGASWDATSKKELDEETKSATSKGTLEGLARNEAGEDIAMLVFQAATESERSQGPMTLTIKAKIDTKASFSASGGYPVKVERKINNEIVGQATILIEIEAEWNKGGKQAVEPAAETTPGDDVQTQEITDPCDPDYVGMEECADAPAEEAADGAAKEAADDAAQ